MSRELRKRAPNPGSRGDTEKPGAEEVAVWALIVLTSACVFATYARLPVSELYHVSRSSPVGGLSRMLVLINFPYALVAIALAMIAFDRLGGRLNAVLATASLALSAVVAWPGVVDESDLDAKAINAVPALGVAVALILSVKANWRPTLAFRRRLRFDRGRLLLAIALVFAGLPWLLAEVGVSISDLPGLSALFLGEQMKASAGETFPVVHLGHHHGADGLYLYLSALLLSRTLLLLGRLRSLVSAYLALMLSYGLANFVQDFWTEQVVKRNWTDRSIPSLLNPSLSIGWALIIAGAVVIESLILRPERARLSERMDKKAAD